MKHVKSNDIHECVRGLAADGGSAAILETVKRLNADLSIENGFLAEKVLKAARRTTIHFAADQKRALAEAAHGLQRMDLEALRRRYREVAGEPPRTNSRRIHGGGEPAAGEGREVRRAQEGRTAARNASRPDLARQGLRRRRPGRRSLRVRRAGLPLAHGARHPHHGKQMERQGFLRNRSHGMNDRMPIKRCAVYTRKSREDGLEQAFNSLDAQREAAEAFVASQRANGWTLLPDRYDDGGFSGGNTDRPGLKKLLEDVRAGKIDVVAVYKIDRLSRSLFDFADLLSEFEKHGVSFVSTTQLIDTSTPMGRMMLGILMTFAQYEREVIAERIRDKIAATKKKGMWVGGRVPFGYRVENHKLVPGPVEAERVRFLFKRYVG